MSPVTNCYAGMVRLIHPAHSLKYLSRRLIPNGTSAAFGFTPFLSKGFFAVLSLSESGFGCAENGQNSRFFFALSRQQYTTGLDI